MWQRNECGPTKQPSAADSYSRTLPAPRTSGLGANISIKRENVRTVVRKIFVLDGRSSSRGYSSQSAHTRPGTVVISVLHAVPGQLASDRKQGGIV